MLLVTAAWGLGSFSSSDSAPAVVVASSQRSQAPTADSPQHAVGAGARYLDNAADDASAAPRTSHAAAPSRTDPVAGPTPAPKGTGTLPPKLQLDPEPKEFLQEWNAPYHATRAALREEQTQLGAGPLREHTFFTTDCTAFFTKGSLLVWGESLSFFFT